MSAPACTWPPAPAVDATGDREPAVLELPLGVDAGSTQGASTEGQASTQDSWTQALGLTQGSSMQEFGWTQESSTQARGWTQASSTQAPTLGKTPMLVCSSMPGWS